MSENRRQIEIGAFLSYGSILLNIVVSLLYTPWMIQQIGQSQYGLYTLANSLIALFMIDFGLSSATARYVSNYHARGEEEKVNQFLGVIYKLYLLIDTVILAALVVIFFCIDTIYAKLTPTEIMQFKVVYCIAASYSLLSFPFVTLNGILTAYEKFIPLKLADVLYRVLLVGMTVFALLQGWGLYALVTVHAIAGLLVLLYKYIVIRRKTPVKVDFHYREKGLSKEIFGYSIWATIASLAQRLVFNITPTILGVVASTASIAVFGIISTIEGYAYILSTAINGMFMPKISRIYAQGDAEKDLMDLMVGVGKFQYFVNGLIVVGFACIGRQFIQLWMGDSYIDAYWGIILVIVPGLFYNSLQIAHTAVMVQNKVKITAFINLATGITNIVLSLWLSREYGVLGASGAIFAAYMLRAMLCHVVYHKVLKVNMAHFARECYIKMALPLILALAAGICITMIPLSGWTGLLIKGILIVIEYVFFSVPIAYPKAFRKA